MKLDHINIAAPADLLGEVRNFYCDILGLEEGPRPDFDFHGYWLYGEGKPIIHLMESDRHYAHERQPYLDHVAFQVEDLQGYVQRLEQAGIEYKLNYVSDFNISQVFCKDPCGNGIEANFFGEQL